jgi:hypothetical protein
MCDKLTEKDLQATADLMAEMLVRAIVMGADIHKVDGKGPKHCPVCIWEDGYTLDNDHAPNNKV